MSVQNVKRETATELQRLEAEQRSLQIALENGDQTVQDRLNEVRRLIHTKRAEAKAKQQKLIANSKVHQAEQQKIGIDTAAGHRQAAKETAGLQQARAVRGQITDATAKEISSNPRAVVVPGHPPDVDIPGPEQLGELVDKLLFPFDIEPEAFERIMKNRTPGDVPRVKDLRAVLGFEDADGAPTGRPGSGKTGDTGEGKQTRGDAALRQAQGGGAERALPQKGRQLPPGAQPQARNAQGQAKPPSGAQQPGTPQPGTPQPGTPQQARLASGESKLPLGTQPQTAGEAKLASGQQPARHAPPGPRQLPPGIQQSVRQLPPGAQQQARLSLGVQQASLRGGLPAQKARVRTGQATVAQPAVLTTSPPGSAAAQARTRGTSPDGIQLPAALLSGAFRSYGTWTDGMLMLWILRFQAEELSARSDRKELKRELDELRILELKANINDRIRARRREIAKMASRFFQTAANFRDNYYRARVKQLIESNPAQARQNKTEMRDINRQLLNMLNPNSVPEHVPGPEMLTPSQRAAVLAQNPPGAQELLDRYDAVFNNWKNNSGAAGEVALYQNAMIAAIQQHAMGGSPPPVNPNELGDTLTRALGTNLELAMLSDRLFSGEPVSDADIDALPNISNQLRSDLRSLNAERQRAMTDAREIFRELSRSPFARAALHDMRLELENTLSNRVGEFGQENQEPRPDDTYRRLMDIHDIGTQLRFFDDAMTYYNPLEQGTRTRSDYDADGVSLPDTLANGEFGQVDALRESTISLARSVQDMNAGGNEFVNALNGHLARAQNISRPEDIRGFTNSVADPFEREMVHTILTLRSADGHSFLSGLMNGINMNSPGESHAPLTGGEQEFIRAAADALLTSYHSRAQITSGGNLGLDADQQAMVDAAAQRARSQGPTTQAVMDFLGGTMAGSAASTVNGPFLYDVDGERKFQNAMNGLQQGADTLEASARESKMRLRALNQQGTERMQQGAFNTVRSMTSMRTGIIAQLMQQMRIARA